MSKNKRPNPYKEANEAFLREKALEEGMHVLDNGVMYRVLEEGHGTKCPKPNGIVYVHYTGRLIDGTVFDTTEGESLPALFVVRDLIMGWQIALTRMHEGDKWEVPIYRHEYSHFLTTYQLPDWRKNRPARLTIKGKCLN